MRSVLAGGSKSCKACATRINMQRVPPEERVAIAKKASVAAIAALSCKVFPYENRYGATHVKRILHILANAKQRCRNPNDVAFYNYGGRGIEFRFPSIRAAAEWVLDNIGSKPTSLHTLDRIDNDRHYEPGNLRWATRTEQARNKREYKRTVAGERIRGIKNLRDDLSYETIRLWIIQGATDEEIIGRRKHARTSI